MSVRNLLLISVLTGSVSMGCAGSPTKADGTVTITQTTSTTTTTVVPKLAAGAIGTSPAGTGLASATVFTFVFVTPPSGGVPPYSVTWNFGDGGAGAGMTPAHLFMSTGNFTATASVTDSMGMSAQASMPVSIGSVSGRWTVTFGGASLNAETIDIVQNQTAVTAAINGTADGLGSGMGSVSNPRTLSISATFAGAMPPYVVTFLGTLDNTLQTWTGTATGYSVCPCNFTAIRMSSASVLGAASSPSFRR
jgi:hypothetical protein